MSRKSENSAAGSAGDGESVRSSYENSPRKTAEFGLAGPFGDFTLDPGFIIYEAGNKESFLSDDDDLETCELKMEYLQRLRLIREKLATIDIANENYYSNCFAFPPIAPNQCVITEIADNSTNEDEEVAPDTKVQICGEKTEELTNQDSRQTLQDRSSSSPQTLKQAPPKVFCSCFEKELSTIELLDLNYNPPKKKPCIRESTPRIALSEGAIPLKMPNLLKQEVNTSVETPEVSKHLFPEIQISPGSNGPTSSPQEGQTSSRFSEGHESLCLIFSNNKEQLTYIKSNRTTITDTTGSTLENSPRLPKKKRRLFLRSARNKVKPVDSMSLWEEIRTMEAIQRKQGSSTSKETYYENILLSQTEQDIDLKVATMGSLDVPRKDSLTSSSKSHKFPSITKITKLCPFSFAFSKKRHNSNKESKKSGNDPPCNIEPCPTTASALLQLRQKQDLSLDDDDDCTPSSEMHSEYDRTETEDDLDEYYQQFCIFCFCF